VSVFLNSSDSFLDSHAHNLIVIKVGTNSIMTESNLNKAFLTELVSEVASLIRNGKRVIIVTSGAIGLGKRRIGFVSGTSTSIKAQQTSIKEQQGLAAIGQLVLIGEYAKRFELVGLECAQILLSQRDLMDKNCLTNIQNTFDFLFEHGIVAIVNENDVVATEELRQNGAFSDNDALAALLSKQLGANLLVMLTSKNGLIGKDGKILEKFNHVDELCVMKKNSSDGRGGIDSKLASIEKVRSCGCDIFISGQDYFKGFSEGKAKGTFCSTYK